MNMQAVVSASVFAPFRRVLRQSNSLRRVYNRLRTDHDLMVTRHIPEKAFSETVRCELLELSRRMSGDGVGDYLEFGVFNGTSLSCVHDVLTELDMGRVRCFGFDSFEGLPQEAADEDGEAWFPGQFACRIDVTRKLLAERGAGCGHVSLIKGWFKDTLNAKTIDQFGIASTSIVMIDCDLYSSTVRCLEFVFPLLTDHSVFIFDDWHSHNLAERFLGERKAFDEFISRHPEFSVEHAPGYNDCSHIVRLSRQTITGG